jgi:hypothetical protein
MYRKIACVDFVATASLGLSSTTSAASQSCGPTLRLQTRTVGTTLHSHTVNGVNWTTNTGPNYQAVTKKWSAHSGTWFANPNGSVSCVA